MAGAESDQAIHCRIYKGRLPQIISVANVAGVQKFGGLGSSSALVPARAPRFLPSTSSHEQRTVGICPTASRMRRLLDLARLRRPPGLARMARRRHPRPLTAPPGSLDDAQPRRFYPGGMTAEHPEMW